MLTPTAISTNASLLRVRTDNAKRIVLDLGIANQKVLHFLILGLFSRPPFFLIDWCAWFKAHTERGAPAAFQAELQCDGERTIEYTVRWFNKTACHAPETIWLSNIPIQVGGQKPTVAPAAKAGTSTGRMMIDKLGIFFHH